MRVLAITPMVDPADDLFGFVHTWMSRLAVRVERLHVLQLWDRSSALPSNTTVYTMGKDGGASRPEQLARFARVVGSLCLGRQVDAVLTHMGPIFAVCAAPFARAAGVPLVLWYAHGAVSPTLRLAHALVDRVGTSTPAGFRLPSTKVTWTGQGIDTDRFAPPEIEPRDGPIVSIGRISPVKGYETLLEAASLLRRRGVAATPRIVGGAREPAELRYRDRLVSLVRDIGLPAETIQPGVPHADVARLYRGASLFASCSQTGSLDKAVLEALATARLAVTCNAAFGPFFGSERDRLTFPAGDAVALADRLEALLSLDSRQRRQEGLQWRERVVAEHGVDHLADELVKLLQAGGRPTHQAGRAASRGGAG
ncbi:MAG: glycosyltransferase family 4 protein [Chloroflexi bacterium]|nr:glycosyltransferase family 4 protein [Chloroflexota bacterium]